MNCVPSHLKGAESQVQEMKRFFLIPNLEFRPAVFVKVTSNWVQLNMRYLVEPKKRRVASSFIYTEVFKRVQGADDIRIASETMDLTVHRAA